MKPSHRAAALLLLLVVGGRGRSGCSMAARVCYTKPNSRGSLQTDLMLDIGALLLDCDGTIAETELGTLEQFNEAFKATPGLEQISWSPELYGKLLKVGASQARFTAFFEDHGWPEVVQSGKMQKDEFADYMKQRKDDMFDLVWSRGEIKLNPGIDRLIDGALRFGVKVAVCSNSNYSPVTKVCNSLLGAERVSKMLILTGDMPEFKKTKKPHPAIYLAAANSLGMSPERCLCVEDSLVGLKAAKGAGMKCVVTPSYFTLEEDFNLADLVVKDLDTGRVCIVK